MPKHEKTKKAGKQKHGLHVTTAHEVKNSIEKDREVLLDETFDQDDYFWVYSTPENAADQRSTFYNDFHRNYVYFSDEKQTVHSQYLDYLKQNISSDTDDPRAEFMGKKFEEKFSAKRFFKNYLYHYRQGINNGFVTGFLMAFGLQKALEQQSKIQCVYGDDKILTLDGPGDDGRLQITATNFCYKLSDGEQAKLFPGYLRQKMLLDERGFEIVSIEASNKSLYNLLTSAEERQQFDLDNNENIQTALTEELGKIDSRLFPDQSISQFVTNRVKDKNLTIEEQNLLTQIVTQLSFESLCGVANVPRTDWGEYLIGKKELDHAELYKIAGFHVIREWYRKNSNKLEEYDDLFCAVELILCKINSGINAKEVDNARRFYLFANELIDKMEAIQNAQDKADYLQQLFYQHQFHLNSKVENKIVQFINQFAGEPFQTTLAANAYAHLRGNRLSKLFASVAVGNAIKAIDDRLSQWLVFDESSQAIVLNNNDINAFLEDVDNVKRKKLLLDLNQVDDAKIEKFVTKARYIGNIMRTFKALEQLGHSQIPNDNLSQALAVRETILAMLKADVTERSNNRHRFIRGPQQMGQQIFGQGNALTSRAYDWLNQVTLNVRYLADPDAQSPYDQYERNLINLLAINSQGQSVIRSIKHNSRIKQLRYNVRLFILNNQIHRIQNKANEDDDTGINELCRLLGQIKLSNSKKEFDKFSDFLNQLERVERYGVTSDRLDSLIDQYRRLYKQLPKATKPVLHKQYGQYHEKLINKLDEYQNQRKSDLVNQYIELTTLSVDSTQDKRINKQAEDVIKLIGQLLHHNTIDEHTCKLIGLACDRVKSVQNNEVQQQSPANEQLLAKYDHKDAAVRTLVTELKRLQAISDFSQSLNSFEPSLDNSDVEARITTLKNATNDIKQQLKSIYHTKALQLPVESIKTLQEVAEQTKYLFDKTNDQCEQNDQWLKNYRDLIDNVQNIKGLDNQRALKLGRSMSIALATAASLAIVAAVTTTAIMTGGASLPVWAMVGTAVASSMAVAGVSSAGAYSAKRCHDKLQQTESYQLAEKMHKFSNLYRKPDSDQDQQLTHTGRCQIL